MSSHTKLLVLAFHPVNEQKLMRLKIIVKSIFKDITITNGATWPIEFQTNGGYFDARKKSLETGSEAECFERVKITSVGLKLDRLQLEHWLLFSNFRNINRCENENGIVGLPVPALAMFMIQLATPPVLLILSDAGSGSCGI